MSDVAAAYKPNPASRDFCTPEGAAELIRRIEQFWDRGKREGDIIKAWVVMVSGRLDGHNRRTIYCVRSNLVRGLPPP